MRWVGGQMDAIYLVCVWGRSSTAFQVYVYPFIEIQLKQHNSYISARHDLNFIPGLISSSSTQSRIPFHHAILNIRRRYKFLHAIPWRSPGWIIEDVRWRGTIGDSRHASNGRNDWMLEALHEPSLHTCPRTCLKHIRWIVRLHRYIPRCNANYFRSTARILLPRYFTLTCISISMRSCELVWSAWFFGMEVRSLDSLGVWDLSTGEYGIPREGEEIR